MNVLTILAVLVSNVWQTYCWNNDYDRPLDFTCPKNQAVSGIRSQHDNGHEDRVFDIQCRESVGTPNHCSWSTYVNNWDEFFSFQCANHGFIHGMHSVHDNGHEDRRWKFYCCEHDGLLLDECYNTQHNNWDAYFAVDIPVGEVMRGVTSAHDNGKEDREYIFELCKLREGSFGQEVIG